MLVLLLGRVLLFGECCLMLQADWQTAADLNLFTDASCTLGFGAYFEGAWIMGTWSKEQLSRSIQWKELFAIVAAAAT